MALANGILHGELIGLAFQGTAYDRAGNIGISGTFMPAYGLNRIFGEIPLLGAILGNGQDRGFFLVLDKGNALELAFFTAHYFGKNRRLGVAVADLVLLDEVTQFIVFHVRQSKVVVQTHILRSHGVLRGKSSN